MLPAKALSEMTTEEALLIIRASRDRRVAVKDKAASIKMRGPRKLSNNAKAISLLEELNALGKIEGEGDA